VLVFSAAYVMTYVAKGQRFIKIDGSVHYVAIKGPWTPKLAYIIYAFF